MLKTPINVYPSEGQVIYIDKTKAENPPAHYPYKNAPVFTFTFQGDLLSWVQIEMYETNTNKKVYNAYAPADGKMYVKHNNDQMTISEQVLCRDGVNGKNYKYRYRLYQNDPMDGTPMCDMYIARGKVTAETTSSTEIALKKDMKNIRNLFALLKESDSLSDAGVTRRSYLSANVFPGFVRSHFEVNDAFSDIGHNSPHLFLHCLLFVIFSTCYRLSSPTHAERQEGYIV